MQQNSLNQLNFKFKLGIAPELEYRVQSVTMPGLDLGRANVGTPFVKLNLPGNISYGDLSVTFTVAEDLSDYLEIFNWMVKLGYPDGYEQYKYLVSDASVIILNSSSRPAFNVSFQEMYPVALSPLSFDSTLPEISYATATATFNFDRFYYEAIKP